jgi:hypothetical protein
MRAECEFDQEDTRFADISHFLTPAAIAAVVVALVSASSTPYKALALVTFSIVLGGRIEGANQHFSAFRALGSSVRYPVVLYAPR